MHNGFFVRISIFCKSCVWSEDVISAEILALLMLSRVASGIPGRCLVEVLRIFLAPTEHCQTLACTGVALG